MNNLQNNFPYAIFGLVFSFVLDIHGSGVKWSEFTFKTWFKENIWRLIVSIFATATGLIFGPELGINISPFGAFWAGLGNDNIVNMINKKRLKKKV